jgi:protein tyrosine phosphatase (PTP) superfamily phosphohydrolase (DUF442 family)
VSIGAIQHFVSVGDGLATAGQPSELELGEVAASGFQVVVNLGLLDPRYCLADEALVVRALGLEYHHVPVDFNAPSVADFERFTTVMRAAKGKRTFVHCAANYRVSCFVALYAEAELGWSRAEADAHVARVWEPNATWLALLRAVRDRMPGPSGGEP